MYERYHIHSANVPSRFPPVPKFVITRNENCINCGKCERACVYGVHGRQREDLRVMADPLSQFCKNCFRCIVECPQRALSIKINEKYQALGDGVWTPQRVHTVWNESEMGKIPVLGAGYRGMFSGPGYDSMWTDMSEIVRPTRDGIHGREHISTSVTIGSNPSYLQFGTDRGLLTTMSNAIDLPFPFVLDSVRLSYLTDEMRHGMVLAADHLSTLLIVPATQMSVLSTNSSSKRLVPVVSSMEEIRSLPDGLRILEISAVPQWEEILTHARSRWPEAILGLRAPANRSLSNMLSTLPGRVDFIHVLFDRNGLDEEGWHARDALRQLHRSLVMAGVRDQVTVIAGGGIAAAEHVPKSIICGADVVALEEAMPVSLGCHACARCQEECPVGIKTAPSDYVEGRLMNLANAWRDQLLEVLGAMGIKEVRRLRGEVGRAIFQEDAERESFAGISGGGSSG